jgi:alpha-glucosidase
VPTLIHPPIAPWCVATRDGLALVLLTPLDDSPSGGRVFVRTLPDNEELLTPMLAGGREGALQRWCAQVPWDRGNALTLYAFVIANEQGHRWLAADGEHALVPPAAVHFRVHPTEQPPAWVRDQVFYQVFPDRFAKSGHGPAPAHGIAAEWGAPIDVRRAASTFYGGDLPGLTAKLPYLQDELGVSALYLNPVFASRSNHRYDTTDYFQVDALLGGNAALADLRQATQARGMRLVLDAVVNHTGAHHPWLAHHPGWYARGDDGQPLGWKGHRSLPVLDFAVPEVADATYAGPQAVLRHWLRPPYAIDGWRLDVIHMLGEGPGAHRNAHHVRAIRRAVREENAQAYVLGEHFSEATRWLQGDQEDGAMNYFGFTLPVRAWLGGLDLGGVRARLGTADFVAALARAVANIPYVNQLAQFNLLDSHDTPRLLTELGGDTALMKLAATLLFTRPGVPCIYYGDELGMQGGADPDSRRCFPWNRTHWDDGLFAHYRLLCAARRQRRDWADGATLALGQGDDWIAYARFTAEQATVVVVNRGPAVELMLPALQATRWPCPVGPWRGLDGSAHAGPGQPLRLPAKGSLVLMAG